MATFTVTNTNDSGVGSLFQAVINANASANNDTIVFAPNLKGQTIPLITGALTLTGPGTLTINGDVDGDGDIDVTIGGNLTTHMFNVAAGASVKLQSLSFASGHASIELNDPSKAGAIVNSGTLVIESCTFDNNTATGTGSSTAASAAGAILNRAGANLSITESAFRANLASAPDGSGGFNGVDGGHAGTIVNLGDLTLAHVLFENNNSFAGNGANGQPAFGSDAGNGGDGGSAAGAVLNLGTLRGTYKSVSNDVSAGLAGSGGLSQGGNSGVDGQPGAISVNALSVDSGVSFATSGDNLGTMGNDAILNVSGSYHGLGGDDEIVGAANSQLFGGVGDDEITGLADSRLFGGAGADKLGNIGGGTMGGGLGNDEYTVTSAATTIVEGSGEGDSDVVRTTVSFALATDDHVETLRADAFASTTAINLTGNALAQTLTGNAGNNILNGGADNLKDMLFGLGGNDTYVLGGSLMDTVVDTAGIDTILSTITRGLDVHLDIENLSLKGNGNINGTGNDLANKINGNIGKNDLIGGKGADTLNGGDGNDRLKGGDGFDVMNGGKGIDLATFSDKTTRVIVSLKETGVTTAFIKGVAADSLTAIENLTGGSGNDVFKGNRLGNTFSGNAGADNLNGGLGNDILTGGTGADKFRFTNVDFGRDRITDFSDNFDKLSFSRSVADSFGDFRISGNGSKSVTVTLGDDTITVQSTKVITLTASDFLFE